MKLAVGARLRPTRRPRAASRVGLGTDGAGSNNSLDLLADVKYLALCSRSTRPRDPAALPAPEAWAVATGRCAPLLGAGPPGGGRAGRLPARRTDSPELALGDLVAGLVYAASGSVVDTTVVAGRG